MGLICPGQNILGKSILLEIEKNNNKERNNIINDCKDKRNRIYFERKGQINSLLNEHNNISYTNNNDKNNENEKIKDNNSKEINIYFLFNEKKELYLTANSSQIFEEVEKELREKYNWINYFTDISFYYSNNLVINNKIKTISELEINNDDTILIKAKK